MGHGVRGVQDTGDVVGLTGLDASNGVRAFKLWRSRGENNHIHTHRRNTHTYAYGFGV